jgi:hypothetical protein
MKAKDEKILNTGLLGALVGYAINGPRGAVGLGLLSAGARTAHEYPKQSAQLAKQLLEVNRKAREVQGAQAAPVEASVEEPPVDGESIELNKCETCGVFHRRFDCPKQAARRLTRGNTKRKGKRK